MRLIEYDSMLTLPSRADRLYPFQEQTLQDSETYTDILLPLTKSTKPKQFIIR